MNRHRLIAGPTLAIPLVLLGCAPVQTPVSVPPPTRPPLARAQFEQTATGPATAFQRCPPAGCRPPTPKTLAGSTPAITEALPVTTAAATVSTPSTAVLASPVTVLTFALGDAALSPHARQTLRAALPQARRATQIIIRGRTDHLGSAAANERLALARAINVRDFLIRQGVTGRHTVQLDARGSCCYVADNDTAAGRARNRRVEVEFVPPAAGATP